MICPHCDKESSRVDFCSVCARILPAAAERSYYDVLGYDHEFLMLDAGDLEKRFFELSKLYHPDRFANKSPLEIQISHDCSAAVNNAYRTLRNPVTRAKYFVEKKFGSTEEKSAKVPMDMADQFFEIQDVLDSIRDSHETPPSETVREVREEEAMFGKKIVDLDQKLRAKFSEYDAAPADTVLQEMQEILSERSYIRSFLRQIDRVLNPEEEDVEEES
jgi:molecular chaperone HscB